MPNKTLQITDERTINTGSTNLIVRFKTLRVATSVKITNKDTTNDITYRINTITGDLATVEAGTSLILNDVYITDIWLSNSSGSNVEFCVTLIGA